MINLKGDADFGNFTTENLLELGLKNIITISEKSWKPTIIFEYLDGKEEKIHAE